MGISKFNAGGNRVDWEVNTEGWQIKKLRDLTIGQVYPLKGFFTTKDIKGFGEGAILISAGELVSIPSRYAPLLKDMLKDVETVGEVKAGVCGFKYDKIPTNKGNDAYVVEFVEM